MACLCRGPRLTREFRALRPERFRERPPRPPAFDAAPRPRPRPRPRLRPRFPRSFPGREAPASVDCSAALLPALAFRRPPPPLCCPRAVLEGWLWASPFAWAPRLPCDDCGSVADCAVEDGVCEELGLAWFTDWFAPRPRPRPRLRRRRRLRDEPLLLFELLFVFERLSPWPFVWSGDPDLVFRPEPFVWSGVPDFPLSGCCCWFRFWVLLRLPLRRRDRRRRRPREAESPCCRSLSFIVSIVVVSMF